MVVVVVVVVVRYNRDHDCSSHDFFEFLWTQKRPSTRVYRFDYLLARLPARLLILLFKE